ncbi:MAG: hypothetical protein GEU82_11095 [Luteitalea sp.]|nr:hypothetical protein [Luteitalea sp.]
MPENSASVDAANWSGEGEFTQTLLDHLRTLGTITFLRVEDAPASRSEADYNFISNEIYVSFAVTSRVERGKRFGLLPTSRTVHEKAMTMARLEEALSATEAIGVPDYSDAGMLQYLRAQRIVPPYQTRGYKLVELVRIYEAGAASRALETPG